MILHHSLSIGSIAEPKPVLSVQKKRCVLSE